MDSQTPLFQSETSKTTMVLTLPKISDVYANLPHPSPPPKHTITECGHRTRFIIALQGSLFLAALLGNVICWNAALIKVAEIETSPLYEDYLNGTKVDWKNKTLDISEKRVDIKPIQTSLLFAFSFLGSAMFVIPAPWIMKKIGTYYTQVFLGLLTTIAAALTPWATVTDFNILYFLRFLQGIAQCNCYPVIGSIVNNWAATREKGIFLAVLTGYTQLSAVLTTPIAGYLANHYGWPSVFYFQALFCGTLLFIWTINYRDNPEKHPFVSQKEFSKISFGKETSHSLHSSSNQHSKIPWYRVFFHLPVWACMISAVCYIYAVQFNISFLVMYFAWILKLPITAAGSIAALPLAIEFILQFFVGILSDKIKFLSEHTKVRLFCTLTFSGCGIGLILMTFIPPEQTLLATIVTVLSFCMLGFNAGGFPKSAVLISPQMPAIVMDCIQGSLTFGLLSGSFIAPGLTPNRTFAEYRILFWIYGILLIFANIFFFIFSKAEPIDFAPTTTTTTKENSDEISEENENYDESSPNLSMKGKNGEPKFY
uniref:Major facilitator superfamily (MFS) profile domain-containing protein n=1 Tax=Panagrolaimus sp. PS1159 TaxID=55785 RepID=A0AC35FL07_9BILA